MLGWLMKSAVSRHRGPCSQGLPPAPGPHRRRRSGRVPHPAAPPGRQSMVPSHSPAQHPIGFSFVIKDTPIRMVALTPKNDRKHVLTISVLYQSRTNLCVCPHSKKKLSISTRPKILRIKLFILILSDTFFRGGYTAISLVRSVNSTSSNH